MKTTKWIIGLAFILSTFSLQAQQQNPQQRGTSTNEIQQQDSVTNPNDAVVDQPGTADTPGATQAAAAANTDEADTTAEASSAPVVVQTTSSSSGSPAVLAGEEGKERDGTNTVQRASMNMAGSPVRNLNLSEDQTVDADTELADRQNHTQAKQASAEIRSDDNGAGSNELDDNNRRENNALSDQNLSSKERKDSKKSAKKKRKKDRG